MKSNQKGFSLAEGLIIFAIAALVGLAGWYVWGRQDSNAPEKNVANNQTESETKKEATYNPIILSGWIKKTDSASGITYAVASEWPDETKVKVYDVDEEIGVGFGDPTHIKFNSTTKAWEAYDSGTKIDTEVAKAQSVEVMGNLPTAAYTTGDGAGGQQRIVFVSGNKVIQIELPSFISITDEDNHANPYANFVDDVIRSIAVKL